MDDRHIGRCTAIICPYCNDYMEFVDEGIDAHGRRCDLYICFECGQQMALTQMDPRRRKPRYSWDPPDGFYED
jgi:hypothetical protein